jgi:hypothetical protein
MDVSVRHISEPPRVKPLIFQHTKEARVSILALLIMIVARHHWDLSGTMARYCLSTARLAE